ncbi:MAG: RimK family alpha-L-glutamate ligase [Gemmatimonadales bacterium]|nr:RimK family alpha-L-glutamate ligase [Gemmatimonadales bacterium]
MTRIACLASRTGWHVDRLRAAAAARGAALLVVPWQRLVVELGPVARVRGGADALDDADLVLPRIIPDGTLEQVILRVDLLHRLEDRGTRVVNPPRAIERTVDKLYTSALLEQAGLRTPETVVTEDVDEAMAAARRLGDCLVKPLFGSMGLGLVRVSDEDTAWRVLRAVQKTGGVFYVQRFVPPGGRDVRAFVVGDRVIGAIERRSDGWKTNVSRGGRATPCDLPPAWAAAAVTAARATACTYAGVDLLPAEDGGAPYLLEVNGIPGWRGLEEATGIDVAGALLDHLLAPAA